MSTSLLGISTMTPQTLVSAYLGTSDAAVYTVPASSTTKIATATVCNVTGSAATVYVGIVASGGTAGVSHHVVHGYTLNSGDTLSLIPYIGGVVLTAADFVTAYSGTATAVTLVLTGTVSS